MSRSKTEQFLGKSLQDFSFEIEWSSETGAWVARSNEAQLEHHGVTPEDAIRNVVQAAVFGLAVAKEEGPVGA